MAFHDCWNTYSGSKAMVYAQRNSGTFNRPVRDVLSNTYLDKWIGRTEPVAWPSRSAKLGLRDFYMWGLKFPHTVFNSS
jgi:hypothetical protein